MLVTSQWGVNSKLHLRKHVIITTITTNCASAYFMIHWHVIIVLIRGSWLNGRNIGLFLSFRGFCISKIDEGHALKLEWNSAKFVVLPKSMEIFFFTWVSEHDVMFCSQNDWLLWPTVMSSSEPDITWGTFNLLDFS